MISVIIPSHNRRLLLNRVLESLTKQSLPSEQFEVIVVLDGCTDGSRDMLREFRAPFSLHVIEQEQTGASAARNLGAKRATGKLLIFLDDDIVAAPGFIQAHLNAHQGLDGLVVIGYSPAYLEQTSFFTLELRGWWEAMFRSMQQPGHRFLFTDVLSGNFSISKEVFCAVGGFDLNFPVHEDFEFGIRLIQAGMAFAFEPKAIGIHHEKTDIKRPLHRKYYEGIADVRLGRMYPEVIPSLLISRLVKYSLLPSKMLCFLRFNSPAIAEWIAAMAFRTLPVFERFRMLGIWRKTLNGLLGYWYWKGVSQELSTLKDVNNFVFGDLRDTYQHNHIEIELDLSQGLDQAEQILDATRPHAVRIYHHQTFIGQMFSEGGAERLRRVHLRPFLVNRLIGCVYRRSASQKDLQTPLSIEEIIRFSDNGDLPGETPA